MDVGFHDGLLAHLSSFRICLDVFLIKVLAEVHLRERVLLLVFNSGYILII